MRTSPKPAAGHGSSDATQSVADCVELTPVALELLALGVDDVRRCARGEALVRQHPLGAGDLALEPLDLGVEVAVALHALRPHDRGEDPLVVALERRDDTAAAEPLGR